jgi:hypothetical protein
MFPFTPTNKTLMEENLMEKRLKEKRFVEMTDVKESTYRVTFKCTPVYYPDIIEKLREDVEIIKEEIEIIDR